MQQGKQAIRYRVTFDLTEPATGKVVPCMLTTANYPAWSSDGGHGFQHTTITDVLEAVQSLVDAPQHKVGDGSLAKPAPRREIVDLQVAQEDPTVDEVVRVSTGQLYGKALSWAVCNTLAWTSPLEQSSTINIDDGDKPSFYLSTQFPGTRMPFDPVNDPDITLKLLSLVTHVMTRYADGTVGVNGAPWNRTFKHFNEAVCAAFVLAHVGGSIEIPINYHTVNPEPESLGSQAT